MARYIDADRFLKDETKRCGSVPLVGTCTTDNDSLAYRLAKAPTADVVEVKHGEWTYKEFFGIEFPECSVCGTQFEDANCEDYPYCPECGAKMDGRRDM